MATPHRGVPLPERTTQYVRVLYARANTPVSFLSHSTTVYGHLMHFGAHNSYPCIREYTSCPWCKDGLRKLWYGWLYGADLLKRGKALLQLTETAVRNNAYLRDPAEDLRGTKIDLVRVTDGKGSFVRAIVKMAYSRVPADLEEPDTLGKLFEFYKLAAFLTRSPFTQEESHDEP